MTPSSRKGLRRRSLLVKVLACFVLSWSVALLVVHVTVETLSAAGDLNEQEQKRMIISTDSTRIQSKHQQDEWFGWQPKITMMEGSSCTVQQCLQGTTPTCHAACRDDPMDFANVPLVHSDWIPDPTLLRRMLLHGRDANGEPWPPALSNEYCAPLGQNDINQQLLDGVPIRGSDALEAGPSIFCGIYTMEKNHATNIRAMRETWAPHCDGFLAFSTASDARLPAVAIEHEGREEYYNMWQKSRSIWKFIGKHYLNDFDYFILGGEDLFVIPGNLRRYLKSLAMSPDDDLFAGRRFKGYGTDNYFNSGGAGYVLSRGTLRKLVHDGLDRTECHAHGHTPMEDVMIAECLRKVFKIGLTDTRDAEGRERFHPFAPGSHLTWKPPAPGKSDWYENYNKEWGIKLGLECCAPDSVSFHYIKKPAMVRHLFSLLYHCPKS